MPFHLSSLMKRLICLLMCLLALCTTAFAEMPNPTVDPSAPDYDSDHPELLEDGQLACAAAILIEAKTGEIIYEKNPDMILYPASTTKVMTVLLGIMYGELESTAVTSYAGSKEGVQNMLDPNSSYLGLREGEQIVFRDLLYGTILRSGNDGAITIAEHISGTESSFVDLMNQTAASLGMTNTHFMNSHGLHDPNHYSTARDLAILARAAMQHDLFRDIANSRTYQMPPTNEHSSARTISTGHRIMLTTYNGDSNSYYYAPITGIKSGSHSLAGYCYIGSAEKDGVELISVVLYSNRYDVWRDTKKLMEYGFSQYTSTTLTEMYATNPLRVYTTGYALDDSGLGELTLSCSPADPTKVVTISGTHEKIEYLTAHFRDLVLVQYTREMVAPILAGEVMGTMTYVTEDGESVVYNLLATRTVPERTDKPPTLEEIVAMTNADPNPLPPLTVEVVLIFVSPFLLILVVFLIVRYAVNRYDRYYAQVVHKKRPRRK